MDNIEELIDKIYDVIISKLSPEELERLRRLGIDPNDKLLFTIFAGIVLGAIQICRRGRKYFLRATPPQNLPYYLFKDEYPKNTAIALAINSIIMKEARGNYLALKRAWKEIKHVKQEEKIRFNLEKALKRLSRLVEAIYGVPLSESSEESLQSTESSQVSEVSESHGD